MALGMEVGLGPGDFVFDGDPATPNTSEGTPTTTPFLAHVYCGETAGWMKTALGTEVDLGPGHIVLDGVPSVREAGTAAPHLFCPCLLWPRSPISATAELLYSLKTFVMAAYSSGQAIIFLHCGFYLSVFFLFSSPNLSRCRFDILLHMVWP